MLFIERLMFNRFIYDTRTQVINSKIVLGHVVNISFSIESIYRMCD